MGKAEPGAGDVPIMLAGQELVLRPSVEACMAISRLGGGAGAASVIDRIHRLDFDTIVEVVSLGTGHTSTKNKQQIQKGVYENGTVAIAADCILFVRIVNNGGRPFEEEEDEEGEGEDRDAPLSELPLESSITA